MSRSTKRNYCHDYYIVVVRFGDGVSVADAGVKAIKIAKSRVKFQSESCEWSPKLTCSDQHSATFRVCRKRLIQDKQLPRMVVPFPTQTTQENDTYQIGD